jgi:hypothetical protein
VSFLFVAGRKIQAAMTNTLALMIKPIWVGWAVCLTDGRELARFRGPGSRGRALRYLRAQFL